MDKLYPVYTLKNECHDCYKCVRNCHVKAIKIENGHASIIPSKCVACGKCVQVCPSGAKKVRNDLEKVKNLLRAKKQVFVSLAPSWRGAFDLESSQIISILKSLGFEGVSETALGAQEVSIETAKMLNNAKNGIYISSACPVVVDFIRYYINDLASDITPIASPALTHAKMLKQTYGENISVVFIGPCIGKKNESDANPDLIDASLTFNELLQWFLEDGIEINNIPMNNDVFVPEQAYEGALYPLEGGMNETIKKCGINENVQLLNISSLESIEKALKDIKKQNLKNPIFIEALACANGCISGPAIKTLNSPIVVASDIISNTKERTIPAAPQTVLEMEYNKVPHPKKTYPIEQILHALQKIGKHSIEDELNCGGCGYETCRELAQALIDGEAETSMCVSYMRKIAIRKAAAMLRCMPSAMVMVDNQLNILEANDAFMRMFTGDLYPVFANRQDGMFGAAIDRIVPFSEIFKTALKTEKDINKERYSVEDKLYNITAFTIEPNQIVGAIITDVTQTEMRRDQIAKKAHEVIEKNISIVQNIACLLGEHMVDTELLLSSIAEGFDTDEETK